MATNNRIFIAFSMDDKWARDYLVGQAKNEKSPFEFVNMSVNEPWDEEWKKQCRTRIKGCDGVIALVSKNTKTATGQLWEINCAKEEKIPMIGIYTKSDDKPSTLPDALTGVTVKEWTWDNIKKFIDSL
ncbi:MAG: TIR domain-containing protein [Rhizomicrobium sp.]